MNALLQEIERVLEAQASMMLPAMTLAHFQLHWVQDHSVEVREVEGIERTHIP